MTRIERFRAYMARMNPVVDPGTAIREKLYVPPPGGSVADKLATGLELEPASTHLVLGGIGSGKTSELLIACERLRKSLPKAGDYVEYIDVNKRHDISVGNTSGVLTALAGEALADKLEGALEIEPKTKSSLSWAIHVVRAHARGFSHPKDADEDKGEWVDVPGALVAPLPPEFRSLAEHLESIHAAFPGNGGHVAFLFDSLDRLPNPDLFREAVQHDLRTLKAAGIGAVVVGPIRFMVGTDRAIADLFDQTHFLTAYDPADPSGLTFLTQVLRTRAEPGVLADECLELLARASGGVMRDLISIAKRAGHEAYSAGHEQITLADVTQAVDAFGRGLAVGLDDEQVKTLRHLQKGKGFVIRGERELSLLETGRILLHGENRFAVHPALAPLLDAMPEAA